MKKKINIITEDINDVVENIREIELEINENITVRNLLETILIYVDRYDPSNYSDYDDSLLGVFTFVKANRKQKARLDYKFLEFIKNFDYDMNKIEVRYSESYGIGGASAEIEDLCKITINNGEPHQEPHIHVSKPRKYDHEFRMSLTTFTQMNGDIHDWRIKFSKKQRKEILNVLKNNNEILTKAYVDYQKGKLITDNYTISYNGRKYFLGRESKYGNMN